MGLRVSGKNLDIGEALRAQGRERGSRARSANISTASYSGHVTVAKDGAGFRTDCVLHLSSGITLEASGVARTTPMRASTRRRSASRSGCGATSGASRTAPDRGRARAERRGRRERLCGARGRRARMAEEADYHPVVIAETTRPLHRLSVSDAVLELD